MQCFSPPVRLLTPLPPFPPPTQATHRRDAAALAAELEGTRSLLAQEQSLSASARTVAAGLQQELDAARLSMHSMRLALAAAEVAVLSASEGTAATAAAAATAVGAFPTSSFVVATPEAEHSFAHGGDVEGADLCVPGPAAAPSVSAEGACTAGSGSLPEAANKSPSSSAGGAPSTSSIVDTVAATIGGTSSRNDAGAAEDMGASASAVARMLRLELQVSPSGPVRVGLGVRDDAEPQVISFGGAVLSGIPAASADVPAPSSGLSAECSAGGAGGRLAGDGVLLVPLLDAGGSLCSSGSPFLTGAPNSPAPYASKVRDLWGCPCVSR